MSYFYSQEKNEVLKIVAPEGYSPVKMDQDSVLYDGIDESDIKVILENFEKLADHDGKLNKIQFSKLYNILREEDPKRLEIIGDIIYSAFDSNNVK